MTDNELPDDHFEDDDEFESESLLEDDSSFELTEEDDAEFKHDDDLQDSHFDNELHEDSPLDLDEELTEIGSSLDDRKGKEKSGKSNSRRRPKGSNVDEDLDVVGATLERLQKVLAAAGLASRRACEEFITDGRVTVDGKVVSSLGMKVDPDKQRICVDGERIKIEKKKYFLVNKPTGVHCTNADPMGRTRVIDLLPPTFGRLFTVGRLDESSEGLILVTNDGELAHRLAHPRFQVERVYRALVAGIPNEETLRQLRQGLYFTEGKFRVRDVRRIKTNGKSTIVEVVLTEGQNREVRRLFARVGHKVMKLKRVGFGPLKLGELQTGAFRPMTPVEVKVLQNYSLMSLSRRPSSLRSRSNRPMKSTSRPGRPGARGHIPRGPKPSVKRKPKPPGRHKRGR